jgi:hypothetical protein
VVWWRKSPDGRELKIVLEGSGWLVRVEGDQREYRGGDLRGVLADAVEADATALWVVVLAGQVEAEAPPLEV